MTGFLDMLRRIWERLLEIHADLKELISLVETLLDRTTDHEFLTTKGACLYAQCSESTLHGWRRNGRLRGCGGMWNRRDLQRIRRSPLLEKLAVNEADKVA